MTHHDLRSAKTNKYNPKVFKHVLAIVSQNGYPYKNIIK